MDNEQSVPSLMPVPDLGQITLGSNYTKHHLGVGHT